MVTLFLMKALLFGSVVSDKNPPSVENVEIAATPYYGRLKFNVGWTTNSDALGTPDSVVLHVQTPTSLSGMPYRMGFVNTVSSNVFYVPLPSDTVTFTVELTAYRRTLPSSVTRRTYLYDPSAVLQIVKLYLKPDSVTIAPGQSVQFCAFLQYNDSTVVIRQQDQGTPECAAFYTSQFIAANKTPNTYQQTKANNSCIIWSATGGTIQQEVCGAIANANIPFVDVFDVKLVAPK